MCIYICPIFKYMSYTKKECSQNLRGPRPIMVEMPLHLFTNKNLRGPGPQTFGFLTNSRAVYCRFKCVNNK